MEITLYRKYRPNSFETVFGQKMIKQTISNALDNNNMAHAYLFSGPRGVGKTTIARIIAKGLNCEVNGISSNPCLKCQNCIDITSGHTLDVIEIDAASNRGIEEIRALKENINYRPIKFRKKVYIIDEVHMLTNEAFNALLKTLEEPPEYAMFILATTEIYKLPETIISRCVTFNFKTLSEDELIDMLKYCARNENIDIDDESLKLVYRKSTGSARDSLSILEQLKTTYTNKNIGIRETQIALGMIPSDYFIKFNELIKSKSKDEILSFIDNIYKDGYDIEVFYKDFCDYLKDTKDDINYIIRTISIIYNSLNKFRFEDDTRILAYLIIFELYREEEKQTINLNEINNNIETKEVNFNMKELKDYLISNSLSNFSSALSEFELVDINKHTIYLRQKTKKSTTRAFLENEYNLRRLEEAIYNLMKLRYKVVFMEDSNLKIDNDFINKLKKLFDVERI